MSPAWIVVLCGGLVHLTLGTMIYSQGNLARYIISYTLTRTLDENADGVSMNVISVLVSASVLGHGLSMPAGGVLSRKIGARLTTLLGCFIASFGVMLTYATIHVSFWMVVMSYGFIFGIGVGVAYIGPLSAAMRWLPAWKGLAIGFVIAGYGLGPVVFIPIQSALINPHNIHPNATRSNTHIYTDPELLDRIPYLFLILGGIYAAVQIVATIFVVDPPDSPLPKRSFFKTVFWLVRPKFSFTCQHCSQDNTGVAFQQLLDGEDGVIPDQPNRKDTPHRDCPTEDTPILANSESNSHNPKSPPQRMTSSAAHHQGEPPPRNLPILSVYQPQSLKPLQVLKRCDFFALWLQLFLVGQSVVFVIAFHKVIGSTLGIHDEEYAYFGALCGVFNTLGRPLWGLLSDITSFKFALVIVTSLMSASLLTLPLAMYVSRWMYMVWVWMFFFCIGGIYTLMPTGVARRYGLHYAAINYGMLATANALSGIVGAVLVPLLVLFMMIDYVVLVVASLCTIAFILALVVKEKKFVLLSPS